MACYKPMPAFRNAAGGVVMLERGNITGNLWLPCGRCIGCRLERARQWSVRIMHEASCYDENCFITLTYDDSELPAGGSLRYEDFQGFMKRFRRRVEPRMVRFYVCGEYGEELGRPHYHACIFNYAFLEDRYRFGAADSGSEFRSEFLESLWPHGNSVIGKLTWESANYAARYITTKVLGDLADEHYSVVAADTGEVTHREPEFCQSSRNPGIGWYWYRMYGSTDVFPHDRVVVNGEEAKPPRYYDKMLRRQDRDLYEQIKDERATEGGLRREDNTIERLDVREQVVKGRMSLYRRKL